MRLQRSRPTEAARHVGSIDETNAPILRMDALDVVSDPQVQYIRAVDFREPQQRQRSADTLHDRAHPEPHLERIRVVAAGCRRFLVVKGPIADQGGLHTPFLIQRAAETGERPGRKIANQIAPGPVREAPRELRPRLHALLGRIGDARLAPLRAGRSPGDEMLLQPIGRGLLHELKLEPAHPAAAVAEHGEALVRVVFQVVDEHQRECRPHPAAVL